MKNYNIKQFVKQSIEEMMEKDMWYHEIAASLGISERTLYRYMISLKIKK